MTAPLIGDDGALSAWIQEWLRLDHRRSDGVTTSTTTRLMNPRHLVALIRAYEDRMGHGQAADDVAWARDFIGRIEDEREVNIPSTFYTELVARLGRTGHESPELRELRGAVQTAFLAAVNMENPCPFCLARTDVVWPYCVHFKHCIAKGLEAVVDEMREPTGGVKNDAGK